MAVQIGNRSYPDQQFPFAGQRCSLKTEKRFMNPIRHRMNYVILPIFVVICAVCLGGGLLVMEIDSERFLPVFILLFAIFIASMVWLLLSVPKTRKLELEIEEQRYDLDTNAVEPQDAYEIPYDGYRVTLRADGIQVNEKLFAYDDVVPTLVTSNFCNRIWLAIRFGKNADVAIYVPLSAEVMAAVRQFRIPMTNDAHLIYLRTHKKNAFAQIYNYGYFDVF